MAALERAPIVRVLRWLVEEGTSGRTRNGWCCPQAFICWCKAHGLRWWEYEYGHGLIEAYAHPKFVPVTVTWPTWGLCLRITLAGWQLLDLIDEEASP